ncbi:4-coumarate:coa ligase-like protein [Strigomonas culicis]|uniref:4-coumarate:coa ligase-like protein n=1 Tax=Strigomonas culicis TaxID=28005 RepID=S9VXT9_9TRYP|nr:4-coumarate:coa ligase-like protein [Strigomonas culicis]|eukprot:EPY28460.1 4-coumarate:coa ligase-like protein [Strigomonas culicis]
MKNISRMFRFSSCGAAHLTRLFQPRSTTAANCTRSIAALRHVATTSNATNEPSQATDSATPGARQYISPEGWRVYASVYPSMRSELDMHRSLYRFMAGRWARAPERAALIQSETKEQLTFGQLQDATEHLAQVLYHHAHVRRGDVLCLMTPNNIHHPAVAFATMRLGAVLTTASSMTTVEVLCYQLEMSEAKVIVTTHAFLNAAKAAAHKVVLRTGYPLRVLQVEDLLAMEAPAIPSTYTAMEEAAPDDVAFLPFSSGTTGAPKGVQLTHRNLIASILTTTSAFPMQTDTDVVLNVLPCFHIYGFSTVMSGALSHNVPQVVMSKYSADTFLQAVEDYRATICFIAPPIAANLLHHLEDPSNTHDFSSMQDMISAAAPLSPEVIRRLRLKAPGLRLGQGWGMTEMSPTVTAYPRGQPEFPPESVGVLSADNEMRIVKVDDSQQSGADRSAGVDVPEGAEGELWVRGPQLMKGYLKQEDTAQCMQDGWYRTGDIGYVDARRLVYISGRLKELIKYKGFQVSPPDVEAELMKHPWVRDCIVLGVPDPQDISFENPRALVVLVDDLPASDAARAPGVLCRHMMRRMPPHKRLHGGVRIVDKVMRSPTGKLMRRQQRMAELEYLKETHG